MQAILERLQKLEKQNRRLKQAGAVSFLILSSLLLMADTSAQRVVEANAFVLVDQDGNHRAELSMARGTPSLLIFGTGKGTVELSAGEAGPVLFLQGVDAGQARGFATLGVSKTGPSLSLGGPGGGPEYGLASLEVKKAGPSLSLEAVQGGLGPSSSLNADALLIEDGEGFGSVLGANEAVGKSTGERHRTSAAALTMYDKEGRVIWRAPSP